MTTLRALAYRGKTAYRYVGAHRGDMADFVGNQGSHLLLKWRESKGLNQGQAARHLDVERFTYRKWETGLGLPSILKAIMLEDKIGIPMRAWGEARKQEAA